MLCRKLEQKVKYLRQQSLSIRIHKQNLSDQLAIRLLNILQPIADRQEVMVQDLHNVAGELQIRSALEKQNQVFEGFKTQLIENQNETVHILSLLKNELQIRPELGSTESSFWTD